MLPPEVIAQLVQEKYAKVAKNVKNTTEKAEWTVLSGIVIEPKTGGTGECVALGSGTQCVGYERVKSMDPGTVVSDSHAEVLCRRAFLAYLLDAIRLDAPILSSKDTKLESQDRELPKIEFIGILHFYSSALPCGDASIIPIITEPVKKRGRYSGNSGNNSTIPPDDVLRTGARPVVGEDPKEPGTGYHLLGVGRTKGGRGPPSWSMSCSDKIAKWAFCGFQGALLSHVIPEPIVPDQYVFGPCESNQAAITRSMSRVQPTTNMSINFIDEPSFIHSPNRVFSDRKSSTIPVVPAASAIIWQKYCDKAEQLDGKRGLRHGVGKSSKILKNPKSHSKFAPKYIFEKFNRMNHLSRFATYSEAKIASKSYRERCKVVEEAISWKKHEPDLDRF